MRWLAALTMGLLLLPATLVAADSNGAQHGLSLFGDLKYAPGFAHFDYVDPAAPKGGAISRAGALHLACAIGATSNSL